MRIRLQKGMNGNPMKVLKYLFTGVLVVLFLLIIGVWIFLGTVDVNRYMPQIAEAVGKATGRQFSAGHAGIALSFKGIGLELKDVRLSDDRQFSEQSFLSIGQVFLVLDVRAMIVAKGIVVSEVNVLSPEITIIRARDGRINAATIGASSSIVPVMPVRAPSGVGSVPAPVSAPATVLPLLIVKKISVRDGVVHYIDRSMDPAITVDIRKISVDSNDFSLTDAFAVRISAAAFSSETNVTMTGRAGVDMEKLAVRFEDVKAALDIGRVLPLELERSFPMIRPAGFRKAKGAVNIVLKSAVLDAKGLVALDAEGTVEAGEVFLEGINMLAAGLNSIPVLPGLAEAVLADLPAGTQEDIRKGITVIDQAGIEVQINKDEARVMKGEMSTRDIAVSVKGVIAFAGTLDLSANLFVSQQLSDILVQKVQDLDGLKQDDGRIGMPFFVKGLIAQPQVRIDADYLAKKLLINRGRQELQKVFDDPAVGQAVGDLLDSIFKKK